MPIPVTVCDDSKLSRKSVIKALPKDWDVEITEATNGLEALEASRAGKADVLFLDLTMPVMDGLEALERLHAEDANTLVVVISADIQPIVKQKVEALGALAFIHKPVNGETLRNVLENAGLI